MTPEEYIKRLEWLLDNAYDVGNAPNYYSADRASGYTFGLAKGLQTAIKMYKNHVLNEKG
jgi:hypothetical protein